MHNSPLYDLDIGKQTPEIHGLDLSNRKVRVLITSKIVNNLKRDEKDWSQSEQVFGTS